MSDLGWLVGLLPLWTAGGLGDGSDDATDSVVIRGDVDRRSVVSPASLSWPDRRRNNSTQLVPTRRDKTAMGQSLRRVLLLAEDDDGEDGEDAVARSSGRLLRASGSLTSIDEWGMIEDDDEDDPDEYNCQSDDDSDSASLVTFAAASHADGGNSGAFTFPDLNSLPTELALEVLSHLNATDLCLAACVWQKLATDEILWQGLCRQQWPEASIYGERRQRLSYRRVYLLLDEGTLTFNSDPHEGMRYFFDNGLVRDEAGEIARFFHGTKTLNRTNVRSYLQARSDVVDRLFKLQDYGKLFLPNALRKCFAKLEAPEDRGRYLHDLLDSFSKRFCQCNPDLGYSPDSVYVMCFSLIILSVDLTSPHVKNKVRFPLLSLGKSKSNARIGR